MNMRKPTTGATNAVVCAILSVGWCIHEHMYLYYIIQLSDKYSFSISYKNNKTFIKLYFIWHSFFRCQTGGHLLVVPRPARLTHSAATLLLWLINLLYLNSGVGRCQKVRGVGGGGTQTHNLCTFGKEPI